MAGSSVRKTLLEVGSSTPSQQRNGIAAKAPFAKLGKYEINVRAFHPNKNFEKQGFRFHGDNRGFSLGESWFDKVSEGPTSRIWQRYVVDTSITSASALPLKIKSETESNYSGPGPGIWRILSLNGQEYKEKKYKPRGTVKFQQIDVPHGGQKIIRIESHLSGENHAFLGSASQQTIFGATVVPTLDVFNQLFVRVERLALYMDIVSLCYGDGFPNCESYVKDAAGTRLFLGTHVRIGYPASFLYNENKRLIWANAIRIEIDKNGNFGSEMWVFAQVLGGPDELRDEYPANPFDELPSKAPTKPRIVLSSVVRSDTVILRSQLLWHFGNVDAIVTKTPSIPLPLHLSACAGIDNLPSLLDATWQIGPKAKTTLSKWNAYHAHRDQNGGRARDDPEYQIEDAKWEEGK
jgi:hypothetical protein